MIHVVIAIVDPESGPGIGWTSPLRPIVISDKLNVATELLLKVIKYLRFRPSFPADRMFDEYYIMQRTGQELFCFFVGRDNGFVWYWESHCSSAPGVTTLIIDLRTKLLCWLDVSWRKKSEFWFCISTGKNVRKRTFIPASKFHRHNINGSLSPTS